jgi:hypothetical protein
MWDTGSPGDGELSDQRVKQWPIPRDGPLLREASTGFEPVMRVLQTLAFPLGHDALSYYRLRIEDQLLKGVSILNQQSSILNLESGRWDSNPRPSPWQGDVLPLNYARDGRLQAKSAETQDRTGDTAIFSRVLYQLSYLGLETFRPLSGCDFTLGEGDCQAKVQSGFYGFFTARPYSINGTSLESRLLDNDGTRRRAHV